MKKILVAYLLLSLTISNPVFAQEISNPTNATASAELSTSTATSTPLEVSQPASLSATQATDSTSLPPNTINKDAEATPTAQLSPTPSIKPAESVVITNDSSINQTATNAATTGNNTDTTIDKAEIKTGSAAAQTVTSTEQNTTTIGNDTSYGVDTIASDSSLPNLAEIKKNCQPSYEPQTSEITIQNNAAISNTIQTSADSGGNTLAAPTATVSTGNATAETDVVNIANTSLVGNCWFYRVINIFAPTSEELVLPNEAQFIGNDQSSSSGQYSTMNASQSATVTEDISNQADAGSNNGGQTTTGTATTETNVATIANTSLYGNSWLLIKIINPQYWHGTFTNAVGSTYQDDTAIYWWFTPSTASSNTQNPAINITNSATVTNSVKSDASTGGNTAIGNDVSLTTGNAHSKVNVFNLLNTSLVGNHWYFVLLNLFDDFNGDIRFARAGSTANIPTPTMTVQNTDQSVQQSPTLVLATQRETEPIYIKPTKLLVQSIPQSHNQSSTIITNHVPVISGSVLGTSHITSAPQTLTLALPKPPAGAFCSKNWEVCTAAGFLFLAGPVQVVETKRRKTFTA